MNQNFPLPTKAWRYSPEYDMEKKIFEAEALFEVYYNVLESAKDNNEWVKKVELDLGKHMSFLYGIFPRPVVEKHAADLPFMKKFVLYLYICCRTTLKVSSSDNSLYTFTNKPFIIYLLI
jgi:hypothetical protein